MLRRNCALASIAALSMLAAAEAQATAQRVFVASYGSAANTAFNCSIAKPCRAFSEAISVASAGGEVIVLDSAGYGSVTITQSVSIIASPGIYAGISVPSGSDGVTINAAGSVLLRGLSINGQGGSIGVNLAQGRVRIENCVIAGMASYGISHHAAGNSLIVMDSIVRDNGSDGISVAADNGSLMLDRVRIQDNAQNGVSVAITGGFPSLTITDSVVAGNSMNGVTAAATGNTSLLIQVERSILSDNGAAGFRAFVPAAPGPQIRASLSRNGFKGNLSEGISLQGSGPASVVANIIENTVQYDFETGAGIKVDGNTATAVLGANSVGLPLTQQVFCSNHGTVYTFGNNMNTNPIFDDGTCNITLFGLK